MAQIYMPPSPTSPRAARVIPAETGGLIPDSVRARKLDSSTSCPTIAKSHLWAFSSVSLSQVVSKKSPAAPLTSKVVGGGGDTFAEGKSTIAVASRARSSLVERRNNSFNREAVVDCKRFGGANNSSSESCQNTRQGKGESVAHLCSDNLQKLASSQRKDTEQVHCLARSFAVIYILGLDKNLKWPRLVEDGYEELPRVFGNQGYLVGCKRSIIAVVYAAMAKSGSRVRVSASDAIMTALVQDGQNSSPTYVHSVSLTTHKCREWIRTGSSLT